MHSHDYLLRLTREELDGLALSHLYTVDEPAVLADAGLPHAVGVRGGYTEWQGTLAGRVVSLAWDWVQLADGAFQPISAAAPRSNVRLLDGKGYDSARGAEAEVLWAFIARIDWQAEAAAALHAAGVESTPISPWGDLKQH
jgi:hypothetical protein